MLSEPHVAHLISIVSLCGFASVSEQQGQSSGGGGWEGAGVALGRPLLYFQVYDSHLGAS